MTDIDTAGTWVLFGLLSLLGLGWVAALVRRWWRDAK